MQNVAVAPRQLTQDVVAGVTATTVVTEHVDATAIVAGTGGASSPAIITVSKATSLGTDSY